MYRKLIIPVVMASACVLGACESPKYNEEVVAEKQAVQKQLDKIVEENTTVVGSIEGVVVEVTKDNTLKIRMPRRDEETPGGLQVNPEGLMEVGFSTLNLPINEKYHKALESYLLNKDVKFVIDHPQEITADKVLGQILLPTGEGDKPYTLVQEYLFKDGLIEVSPQLTEIYEAVKRSDESCRALMSKNELEKDVFKAVTGTISCVKDAAPQ